ncbi:hypothetical protein LLB_0224 [Legionella longbeachae D-4968]|nr:hypothetical protein LLB_0224 [Legionella longbeachae D-4968]
MINKPITVSRMNSDLEKQIVFLAHLLIRVREVKILRSIF